MILPLSSLMLNFCTWAMLMNKIDWLKNLVLFLIEVMNSWFFN